MFSLNDCSYNIEKEKESTARVVLAKEFKIYKSYTCEASVMGSSIGKYAKYLFTPALYYVF